MMLFGAVLYVATSVGSCWWTISARAVLMDVTFWQFSNNPPNYSSVANAMKFLVILNSTYTGPFSRGIACIGVLDFVSSKKYPLNLLRSSGSDM